MKLRTVHLAILLLTVIAGTLSSAAQEIQERTVNLLVKNGARFDHLIPNSMKYILPQFEECRLLTSYGEEYVGLVNANITTGTLNTISPEGDTVGVTISDCINRITASNRTIIKRDGKYLSVMLEHRDIALCIMPTLKIDMFAEADPTTEALYSIKDKVSLNTGSYTVIMYSGPTRPTYRDHSDMVTVRCKYTTQYVIAISEKIYPCKLSSFLKAFRESRLVEAAFYGLRPASTGLIAAAGIPVIITSVLTADTLYEVISQGVTLEMVKWPAVVLAVVIYVLSNHVKATKKLHPILFIAFAAVVGVVFRLGGA